MGAPPEGRVRAMFDDLVARYDLLNDVLSMGFDRWWRRRAATTVRVRPGGLVLDLGCGTGRLAERLPGRSRVVGLDLSHPMLMRARARLDGRIRPVQGSAFALPFADGVFEGAASAFVLRNLDDLPRAFTELARVLRPGAPVAVVDITEPTGRLRRQVFDGYFRVAAPALGRLAGKGDAYRYLVRSLAHLPPAEDVAAMLRGAGFAAVRHGVLPPGMVTLWTAERARTETDG